MSLEIKNITKIWDDADKNDLSLPVLDKISFDVADGEFVSVVGQSGCGKSTLINIIAGIEKPTSGSVIINGEETDSPGRDRALILQENALFPWLNVEKNVEFGLKAQGIGKEERREKAEKYIKMVGLSGYEAFPIHKLSGGMKQRVSIARGLALETDILLMDEPFVAVDSQTRSVLHSEFLKIWRGSGKTVLFITHDVEEAVLLSDRVIIMGMTPDSVKEIVNINIKRPRSSDGALFEKVEYIKRLIDRFSVKNPGNGGDSREA